MKTAHVVIANRLSQVPNRTDGHAVIRIVTDISSGQVNSFFMDPSDLHGNPLLLEYDHPLGVETKDPTELNVGDEIQFDIQDGLNKAAIWNGRKFRQRSYSFDVYAGPM